MASTVLGSGLSNVGGSPVSGGGDRESKTVSTQSLLFLVILWRGFCDRELDCTCCLQLMQIGLSL